MPSQRSSLLSHGHHLGKHSPQEREAFDQFAGAFKESRLPLGQRLANFPRHVRRQDVARFLAKYELFKLALPANGSVAECGVFAGGGLLGWAHFSAILEPYNHTRRVIGFDTFTGFPDVNDKDSQHGCSEHLRPGAFATHDSIRSELEELIRLHDQNRPLGHVPKVELIAGDARVTIPRYVEEHGHLLLSLLYLDFDLYEPTAAALSHLYPRVVGGGVVAFDELNCAEFPGETQALLEVLSAGKVRLRRFPFDPYISYFIKDE
jgi:hypothetical protein